MDESDLSKFKLSDSSTRKIILENSVICRAKLDVILSFQCRILHELTDADVSTFVEIAQDSTRANIADLYSQIIKDFSE